MPAGFGYLATLAGSTTFRPSKDLEPTDDLSLEPSSRTPNAATYHPSPPAITTATQQLPPTYPLATPAASNDQECPLE
ncbi:hypothetical protein CC2G_005001 [Coprinopsis cinerea AmutBmut pab1-1]|nr:hypothetical protein CC2G_005001 [Coprinopsis cinerea AmutBmut pab1-1]